MMARFSIRRLTLMQWLGALIGGALLGSVCVIHFAQAGSLAVAASEVVLKIAALATIGVTFPHVYGFRRYWFEEPITDPLGLVRQERRPSPLGLRLSLCAAFLAYALLCAGIVLNCFPSNRFVGLGRWLTVASIAVFMCNIGGLYCVAWLADRRSAARSYHRGER